MKRQHLIDRIKLLADKESELKNASAKLAEAVGDRAYLAAARESELRIAAVEYAVVVQRYLGGRSE